MYSAIRNLSGASRNSGILCHIFNEYDYSPLLLIVSIVNNAWRYVVVLERNDLEIFLLFLKHFGSHLSKWPKNLIIFSFFTKKGSCSCSIVQACRWCVTLWRGIEGQAWNIGATRADHKSVGAKWRLFEWSQKVRTKNNSMHFGFEWKLNIYFFFFLNRLQPQGVDIVLDCLCGEECNKGYSLLKPMGKYVLYGSANVVTGETKSFFSVARSWWQVDKGKIQQHDRVSMCKLKVFFLLLQFLRSNCSMKTKVWWDSICVTCCINKVNLAPNMFVER